MWRRHRTACRRAREDGKCADCSSRRSLTGGEEEDSGTRVREKQVPGPGSHLSALQNVLKSRQEDCSSCGDGVKQVDWIQSAHCHAQSLHMFTHHHSTSEGWRGKDSGLSGFFKCWRDFWSHRAHFTRLRYCEACAQGWQQGQ